MTLPKLALAFVVSAAAWTWLSVPLCGLLLIASAGAWALGRGQFRPVLKGLFFTMCWCGLLTTPSLIQSHLSFQEEPTSVDVSFTILGDPQPVPSRNQAPRFRIPATAHVEGAWLRRRTLIEIDQETEVENLFIGTSWRAQGRLESRDGVYVGLFRSGWRFFPDPNTLESQPLSVWENGIYHLFQRRRGFSKRLYASQHGNPENRAVLQALLLGDRRGMDQGLRDRFARTGLVHIFAISGLHIGMLAGMLWFLLKRVGVTYRVRVWFILPILLIFVTWSGWRASSLRAVIMLVSLWVAPFWYRRTKVSHAFALACCFILAISPGQIADLGFQYSFLLVAALLLLAPELSRSITSFTQPDPWAPVAPKGSKIRRWIWRPLSRSLAVSLVCVLISAPLTAAVFNLCSPIGFVGNLVAVPLVFLILLTGFPVMLLSLFPFLDPDVLWRIPLFFTDCLLTWTGGLESVSFAWLWVRAPDLWLIGFGYGFLFLGCVFRKWSRPCWSCVLGLILFYGTQEIMETGKTELVILPTERGQAFLLRKGFKPSILIDTGSSWDSWKIQQVLKEKGVNRIAAVYFTHQDTHHSSGWNRLRSDWKPNQFFASRFNAEDVRSRNEGQEVTVVASGERQTVAGWEVEILHPSDEWSSTRSDDQSLVIRINDGFRSLVVMGGAGEKVEKSLLSQGTPLSARILCAGHPRDQSFLHPDMLFTVDPELVIFSGEAFRGITDSRREAEQRSSANNLRILRGDADEARILLF